MGLGSTARKIQKLSDTAEELYHKLGEILERIREIEHSIEDSSDRLRTIEHRLDQQAVLIEAIAEANDIDPEELEFPEPVEPETEE